MAARIIHIGADTCHRLPVLESAGYLVHLCLSVLQLQEVFAAEEQLDAVLISEAGGLKHQEAALLARSRCSAPIVLFRDTQRNFTESAFDLVVPVLEPPDVWLAEVEALIQRSQGLQAQSRQLCEESAVLRQETAVLRAKSRQERLHSREECAAQGAGDRAGKRAR